MTVPRHKPRKEMESGRGYLMEGRRREGWQIFDVCSVLGLPGLKNRTELLSRKVEDDSH